MRGFLFCGGVVEEFPEGLLMDCRCELGACGGGVHGLGRGGLPACNEEEYCQRDAYYYDCKGDEECFCGFICQSGDIVAYLFGDSGAFCDGRQDDGEQNQHAQERKYGYVDGGHGDGEVGMARVFHSFIYGVSGGSARRCRW